MKERPQEMSLPLDKAPLDKKVVLLVRALNEAGYTTAGSCQGGRGHGCIVGLIEFEYGVGEGGFNAQERQEIREIVRRFTNVPFKFRSFYRIARLLFDRPL